MFTHATVLCAFGIVFSFVLLAILGGLVKIRLCPQAQNTSVKSAILGFLFFKGM